MKSAHRRRRRAPHTAGKGNASRAASPPSPELAVAVANRQRTRKIHSRLLKRIAAELLAGLKIKHAELEITLLAAPEMTCLNESFLRHEGPTDVIAFDYRGDAPPGTPPPPALRGEIFICVDEAVLQAKKFKTRWQSEIVRYLVHGVLHLLGYDDSRAPARRAMRREENRWLRGLTRRFSLAHLAGATKLSA